MKNGLYGFILVVALLYSGQLYAAAAHDCLPKAQSNPDFAYVEAEARLKKNGHDRQARMCLAVAAFEREDFVIAGENFAKLAESEKKKSKSAELYAKAGWAFLRAKDLDRADEYYTNALEHAPDKTAYWIDRATVSMDSERYWDAIDDLNEAIKRNRKSADAYAWRGQAWVKLGMAANARSDVNKAMELDPDNNLAWELYDLLPPPQKAEEGSKEKESGP